MNGAIFGMAIALVAGLLGGYYATRQTTDVQAYILICTGFAVVIMGFILLGVGAWELGQTKKDPITVDEEFIEQWYQGVMSKYEDGK